MIPEPLRILCIGDTRPGHEKQSLAMVEAFSRLTPVEERWFRIPDGRPFAFFSMLSGMLSQFFPSLSGRFLKKYGWKDEKFHPDLVIGAGSHTHGSILLFGTFFRAKTLVCMTPGKLLRSRMDLVLSPMHDGLENGKNVLVTLGPPCRQVEEGKRRTGHGLLLVGGIDPSSHAWENEKLMEEIEKLLCETEMTYWIAGSSPRTPEETEKSLKNISLKYPQFFFFPFSETKKGWVEDAFASSEEAWITADSISMVYESLTAGCRVGVLPVTWRKKENKFMKSLDFLHNSGLIRYSGEKYVTKDLPGFDEAGRAAKEALRLWWQKD